MENYIKGYITGFFDGEGYVGITSDKFELRADIGNTNLDVLERIKQKFGGEIHKNNKYENRMISYLWYNHSDNKIKFLEYIYTYSIVKRQQIKLAIDYQNRKHNLNIEQRNWYVNELKRLKNEEYDKNIIRNYENEIKKLEIPKEIREGKQATLSCSYDIYKQNNTDNKEEAKLNDNNTIQEMPEDVFIGYVAGFFDGEGTVTIEKSRDIYTLRASINSTTFESMKLISDRFEKKLEKCTIRELDNKEGYRKQQWKYRVNANESLLLLKKIFPYTIIKREQIKYAIEFQEWKNQIGKVTTFEHRQKADWYYRKLRELKKEIIESVPKCENEPRDIKDTSSSLRQAKLEF